MFKSFFTYLGIGIFLILNGCETYTVGSMESLETQGKRPWDPDKSTVAGFEKNNKLLKSVTPRIGFNMPIEEPSKEILKTREIPDLNTIDPYKTQLDKKNHSIKIVVDQYK